MFRNLLVHLVKLQTALSTKNNTSFYFSGFTLSGKLCATLAVVALFLVRFSYLRGRGFLLLMQSQPSHGLKESYKDGLLQSPPAQMDTS